jgi:hypothetical protein
MKKRLIIIFAVVLSMFSFSCEKTYLDTVPTDSVDAASAYATTKNAAAAIRTLPEGMGKIKAAKKAIIKIVRYL